MVPSYLRCTGGGDSENTVGGSVIDHGEDADAIVMGVMVAI